MPAKRPHLRRDVGDLGSGVARALPETYHDDLLAFESAVAADRAGVGYIAAIRAQLQPRARLVETRSDHEEVERLLRLPAVRTHGGHHILWLPLSSVDGDKIGADQGFEKGALTMSANVNSRSVVNDIGKNQTFHTALLCGSSCYHGVSYGLLCSHVSDELRIMVPNMVGPERIGTLS